MIFGDEEAACPTSLPPTPDVTREALLAACAAEVQRQAQACIALDHALGRLCAALPVPPLPIRDLQAIDRLRQELEGLARVMALLSTPALEEAAIPRAALLACTPLRDLRARLLGATPEDEGMPATPRASGAP